MIILNQLWKKEKLTTGKPSLLFINSKDKAVLFLKLMQIKKSMKFIHKLKNSLINSAISKNDFLICINFKIATLILFNTIIIFFLIHLFIYFVNFSPDLLNFFFIITILFTFYKEIFKIKLLNIITTKLITLVPTCPVFFISD